MLRNAARLAPQDGSNWRLLSSRVADQQSVEDAIRALESGDRSRVPKSLILEGSTHADCLIECEQSFVWIEGKRFDWLSPSIKWDVTRDQLARNVEAVWSLAAEAGKDFCVIVCHEGQLKHHEQLLIDGYRSQSWSAGWPHIDASTRGLFADRIGTLTWLRIAREWPQINLGAMLP